MHRVVLAKYKSDNSLLIWLAVRDGMKPTQPYALELRPHAREFGSAYWLHAMYQVRNLQAALQPLHHQIKQHSEEASIPVENMGNGNENKNAIFVKQLSVVWWYAQHKNIQSTVFHGVLGQIRVNDVFNPIELRSKSRPLYLFVGCMQCSTRIHFLVQG